MPADFVPMMTDQPGEPGPDVYRLTRAGGIGMAVAEFPRSELIHLVDYPELPLRASGCETIKVGRSSLVVKTEFPYGTGRISVAYKRVRRKNWWKIVTGSLRPNRASRAWRLGRALLERGIATPRPIAVVLPRKRDLTADAYLATEWIEGSTPLPEFMRRAEFFDVESRRRLLTVAAESLGGLLGRMHAAGVRHRDLKPSNLLIVETETGLEAMITDLDGAAVGRSVPRRVRRRDLARLIIGTNDESAVSHSLRSRFLNAYLCSIGETAARWKSHWRELRNVASIRTARKARRAA